jgi:hypothetical protein
MTLVLATVFCGYYICDQWLLVINLNISSLAAISASWLHYFQSTLFRAISASLLGVLLYLAGKLQG